MRSPSLISITTGVAAILFGVYMAASALAHGNPITGVLAAVAVLIGVQILRLRRSRR